MNDKMFTIHTMIEQPVLKSGGFRTLKESMIHKDRPYIHEYCTVEEVEESRGNDLHVFGNGCTPVG